MKRQKQIPVTDEILAQIEHVTKTSLEADDIVVFEAVAASTRPISKGGSIYNGAVMSRNLLQEMATGVNTGEHSVPLHTLHLQGDEIPVGRVFNAWVEDVFDGSSNLVAMFYLPKLEQELIQKINLSVLDEVSVGVKSQHAYCSKCGFDYFGEKADFMNLWTQTCENDHVLGEDGTHLKLDGLDYWVELSLVSRGASNKPKILSRARQTIPQETQDRVAASGVPVEATLLVTSINQMEAEMPKPKTPEELAAEATAAAEAAAAEAAAAEAAAAEKEEETPAPEEEAEEENATLDAGARIAELRAEIDALEASLKPKPTIEDLQAQLAAANARISELEAPEEKVAEEEVKLDLPVGGVSLSAVEDAKTPAAKPLQASAFKTNRKHK